MHTDVCFSKHLKGMSRIISTNKKIELLSQHLAFDQEREQVCVVGYISLRNTWGWEHQPPKFVLLLC